MKHDLAVLIHDSHTDSYRALCTCGWQGQDWPTDGSADAEWEDHALSLVPRVLPSMVGLV